MCVGEFAVDAGEDTDDGAVDGGVVRQLLGDVDKGYVDGDVAREEGAVEAVGLADAAAHLHAVDGMAHLLLGYRDEKLGAVGGAARGVDAPQRPERIGHDGQRSGIAAVKKLADSYLAAEFFYFI